MLLSARGDNSHRMSAQSIKFDVELCNFQEQDENRLRISTSDETDAADGKPSFDGL